MKYSNPVNRGFFPDPSVIRVKDDYYLVNSSFQYFPCIPISHSKDMVNWEIIGHAITNPDYLDLSEIKDSHGIWAPDIFFYDNEFYIIATMRLNDCQDKKNHPARRQLIMKSKNPEGPYSKPVWLDADSIDPSLFVDDNGKKYMITAKAATAWELSDDFMSIISPKRTIWAGTGERCSEGPHILKHNGYYYAMTAEGGTGYGHGINIARSRELFGNYEECPYNPIMRQTNPDSLIQRAGHGKLVEDQNGNWWAYYLCGRRNEGNYTTLGRETALDPVTWTDDGWFLINEGKGPSENQDGPELPVYEKNKSIFVDEFNDSSLGLEWEFVRNPDYNNLSLNGERPSHLRIYTGDKPLSSISSKNTLLHRESEFKFTAETKLDFIPQEDCCAGITCYYSTSTYIRFNISMHKSSTVIELVSNRGNGEMVEVCQNIKLNGPVYLKVKTDGQKREFMYSTDGNEYIAAGTVEPCTFLCDEGVPGDRKRHTGTLTGIFANNGNTGKRIYADFDWFKMKFE